MEVIGVIKVIGDVKEVSASYKKRELVVSTSEQYTQTIAIEFAQDKTALLDFYNIGDNVKVSINLGGREWVNTDGETKYFNSVKGWKIEKNN
jgi:translation initiation factor IF-3